MNAQQKHRTQNTHKTTCNITTQTKRTQNNGGEQTKKQADKRQRQQQTQQQQTTTKTKHAQQITDITKQQTKKHKTNKHTHRQ